MKKNSIGIIIASVVIAIVATIAFVLVSAHNPPQVLTSTETSNQDNGTVFTPIQNLKKFNSTGELQKFLLDSQVQANGQYYPQGTNSNPLEERLGLAYEGPLAVAPVPSTSGVPSPPQEQVTSSKGNTGAQFSQTNVQVAGIDEPDFLKNDNKYAYVLSQDKVTIIDAFPGSTSKIVSKVGIDVKGQNLQNMFLNKDMLVIFYNDNREQYSIQQYDYIPNPIYTPVTHAVIINASDKENPKILKNYEVTGFYSGARMIGNFVYLISNSNVDYVHPLPPILRESSGMAVTPEVYYFDNPEPNYNFNTITMFNIFSGDINSKTFLMGSTGTLYVSDNAIYLTYQKYQPYYYDQGHSQDKFFRVILPLLPNDLQVQINSIWQSNLDTTQKWTQVSDLMQNDYNKMSEGDKNALFDKISKAVNEFDIKIQQDYRKTVIQKFTIEGNGTVSYAAKGEVPGYLLNQYSMDESGKRFRVATTTEYYSAKGVTTANNVYVLGESLKILGSLEKVAPEESIYAARFMGDRLYLVTYQRIDPFFVIDLSTDFPKVLGALKIPGYSSYLHPYDETHVIGIGKETKQNQYGGLVPFGVKVALFDVSNVANPVTVDSYTIGSQGTDSEVLNDPKALLFDKVKDILSIPISNQYYGEPIPLQGVDNSGVALPTDIMPPRPFFANNWKGFYVFGIDPVKGFRLKGIIEHSNGTTSYEDYGYGSRSFYIDNSLYTLTSGKMKINDLNNLNKTINEIMLSGTGQLIKYLS